MNFNHPTCIYTAAGNIEASGFVLLLQNNGIEAYAVDDVSRASLFAYGKLTQFHQPKVYVDRDDAQAAARLIHEFERREAADRRVASGSTIAATEDVPGVCEECGETTMFPVGQDRTIQRCGHCGKYLDVGAIVDGDWSGEEE